MLDEILKIMTKSSQITCNDIDFRFGFSASAGLAASEAGWAGEVG